MGTHLSVDRIRIGLIAKKSNFSIFGKFILNFFEVCTACKRKFEDLVAYHTPAARCEDTPNCIGWSPQKCYGDHPNAGIEYSGDKLLTGGGVKILVRGLVMLGSNLYF